MKTIIISICLILLSLTGNAQNNLIHNAGFENWHHLQNGNDVPCKPANLPHTEVWEDDHNFVYHIPCNYLDCGNNTCEPCAKLHTPDWYKYYAPNSLTYYHFKEKTGSTPGGGNILSPVSARSGIGYVGIRGGEIFEQKFFDGNGISGNKKYTFSMYVRIPNHLSTYIPTFGAGEITNSSQISEMSYNVNSVFSLNVYIATDKIKYSDRITTCANANVELSDDNFKDLSFNHIVKIKNFQISPSQYPYGQWHKLTFEFECPSNYTYKWIGIEQDYNDAVPENRGYILIDDISLVESCELGCYPTSGTPSPVINSPAISYNVPLQVSNIQNIEKLKMEIFPMTGQSAIFSVDFNYTNGIGGSIYWSGETFSGGTAAVGSYICKLTCENECGPFTFSQNIFNAGAVPPYPPVRNLNKIEPRDINPCCVIDYTLQNRTFNSAKNFQVKERIYVTGNVQTVTNGNLELVAGKSVEITNEFSAGSASLFSANIVECADAHRISNPVLTDADFIFYEPTGETSTSAKITESIKATDALSVLPNPSKGQFTIKSKNPSKGSKNNIAILDLFGRSICSFNNEDLTEGLTIDLSKHPNGVYILRYADSDGHDQTLRIVKQD